MSRVDNEQRNIVFLKTHTFVKGSIAIIKEQTKKTHIFAVHNHKSLREMVAQVFANGSMLILSMRTVKHLAGFPRRTISDAQKSTWGKK